MLRASALRAFLAVALLAAVLAVLPASAQDLASFEKRTTVHTLDNGWTFVLVQRPVAPVFSFATFVDVGSAQEVPGITGLAHMFEHMAFKGTPEHRHHRLRRPRRRRSSPWRPPTRRGRRRA